MVATCNNTQSIPQASKTVRKLLIVALALHLPSLALADTFNYVFITGDKNVGHLTADTKGDQTTIDFDVKNNGRGPTIAESITLDAAGLPTAWTLKGSTTFGSKIAEHFTRKGTHSEWVDSAGKGQSTKPGIYLAQSSSPWANGIYARALLKLPDMQMPALPGGVLRLEKGETFNVQGSGGPIAG